MGQKTKDWNKSFSSKLLLTISIIVLSLFQPLTIIACGMSMISTSKGWTYGNDSAEQSFINYVDGKEKLIISRNFTNSSNDSVWVIPLPTSPQSVKIDILTDIPKFSGYDVRTQAKDNLTNIRDKILLTHLYPAIPMFIINSLFGSNYVALTIPSYYGKRPIGLGEGVSVYQHLEKDGVTTEVLSATNSDALYEYLNEKGLKVEKNSISVLQDYIGKNFTFVASWVNSSAKNQPTVGLLMTFPTNKIYYPLKPESETPGEGLPETITIVGHVTPKLFTNIKKSTTVDYYYSDTGSSTKNFFTTDQGFGFTKVVIDTKPSNLTEDLYISPAAPIRIVTAQLINLHTLISGLFFLVLLSFLTTQLVIRLVIPSSLTKSKRLGFSAVNCLTLIGTIVGCLIFLKEKRLKFIITYSLIFVFLSWTVISLISLAY